MAARRTVSGGGHHLTERGVAHVSGGENAGHGGLQAGVGDDPAAFILLQQVMHVFVVGQGADEDEYAA